VEKGATMLADYEAGTMVATSDLERARDFYERVIGLSGGEESPGGSVQYRTPHGNFLLYVSEFAGTNKATAFGFEVNGDAFDAEIARLREAGVTFDTFDMPPDAGEEGMSWDGDVARMGDMRAVWFRDPDNNIIAVSDVGE
jgi:catechol 2,3-dioxygenase-like lactoylglutathione lyase family enzyme